MKQQVSHPRTRLFAGLCVCAFLLMVFFGVFASRRSRASITESAGSTSPATVESAPSPVPPPITQPGDTVSAAAPAAATSTPGSAGSADTRKLVYYRTTALGPNYGKLSVAPVDALDKVRYSRDLLCDRVYFAAGKGVCLASDRGVFTNYYATKFYSEPQRGWTIPLGRLPNRFR